MYIITIYLFMFNCMNHSNFRVTTKGVEKQMDQNEFNELTKLLLEQLPLGLVVTDSLGDIVYVNNTAEKIRRIDRQKLIGKNIQQCHPKGAQERMNHAVENLKNNPEIHYKRMVEDTVNNQFYMNNYASIFDKQKQFKGMVVLTEDITEKRKLEQEQAKFAQIQNETINNIKIQYHNLLVTSLESISAMLEAKDRYTQDHSKHVCQIALRLYEHK